MERGVLVALLPADASNDDEARANLFLVALQNSKERLFGTTQNRLVKLDTFVLSLLAHTETILK